MTRNSLKQAQTLDELISRRFDLAEQALVVALRRLSSLDDEIARLCIERARVPHLADDATAFVNIEARRSALAKDIDRLRQDRLAAETETEALRERLKRMLRRKIALKSAVASLSDETRRIASRRH